MKLGTETGSLVNHVLAGGTNGQPTPEVGMGITLLMWTDRHAGTITRLSPSGKTFWFKEDIATRVDANGMSEAQDYKYTADPTARERMARQGRNGQWRESNRGAGIALGYRRAYHDYSF